MSQLPTASPRVRASSFRRIAETWWSIVVAARERGARRSPRCGDPLRAARGPPTPSRGQSCGIRARVVGRGPRERPDRAALAQSARDHRLQSGRAPERAAARRTRAAARSSSSASAQRERRLVGAAQASSHSSAARVPVALQLDRERRRERPPRCADIDARSAAPVCELCRPAMTRAARAQRRTRSPSRRQRPRVFVRARPPRPSRPLPVPSTTARPVSSGELAQLRSSGVRRVRISAPRSDEARGRRASAAVREVARSARGPETRSALASRPSCPPSSSSQPAHRKEVRRRQSIEVSLARRIAMRRRERSSASQQVTARGHAGHAEEDVGAANLILGASAAWASASASSICRSAVVQPLQRVPEAQRSRALDTRVFGVYRPALRARARDAAQASASSELSSRIAMAARKLKAIASS